MSRILNVFTVCSVDRHLQLVCTCKTTKLLTTLPALFHQHSSIILGWSRLHYTSDWRHFRRDKYQFEYEKEFLVHLYLSHNQPFNCVRLNISSSSTTPPLKTTLFLWFHISDTIATHNPFHALLTLSLCPRRQKL